MPSVRTIPLDTDHVSAPQRPLPYGLGILMLTTALLAAGCQSNRPDPATPSAISATAPAASAATTATPAATGPTANAATASAPAALPVRGDLWDRIRAGFRFDLTQDNERIAMQRNWYLRNQQYLDRVIARGSRYLHYIVEETEARDMPLELALLPIVESAFDPYAYSHAHAAGPWQFIPSTGKIYGLKQTWWYDGRRDIESSTRAALDYLERLAARFDGDYYKALASYNAGAGTVGRAVTRNVRAGKKTDYWSLKVPQETSAYVPKLIALAQIVQDPAKYGVRLNPIPDEPRFVGVDVGRQIDLARAAELADIPLAELYLFNPAHSRWVTDPQGNNRLLVPVELADAFRDVLAGTPEEEFVVNRPHQVAPGETLEDIAKQHQVPAETLRMVNHLSGDTISPGETLLVPQPRATLAGNESSYEQRLLALNRGAGASTGRTSSYTVRAGDTLSGIARKQKVSMRDLARWNKISPSKALRIGQRLTIHSGGGSAPVVAAKKSTDSSQKRISHKVKPGETLSGLARRFKVSVHDIARWNQFSPNRQLRIGESVRIYLD